MSTVTVQTISNGVVSTSSENVIRGSARAWVNFNGTGTVAIRASYNVSSITDNGTGDYTVNFTNALPTANYAIAGAAKYTAASNNFALTIGDVNGTGAYSTTAVRVCPTTGTSTARYDCDIVTVIVVGS
jgi:hypothetical protein